MANLQRTRSFDHIPQRTDEPSAPIYQSRNPERDNLGDLQSVLDRLSLEGSSRNETGIDVTGNRAPPPSRNEREVRTVIETSNGHQKIEKFNGIANRMDVEDWIFRFEIIFEIGELSDHKRINKMLQNTEGEANTLLFQALKEAQQEGKSLSYEDLKRELIESFTSDFDSTYSFNKLMGLSWRPGENLLSYWMNKLKLIERADPNLSYKTKKNLLISGLPANLKIAINASILNNEPKNLSELYDLAEAMYEIYQDGGFQFEKPKKANIVTTIPTQNEPGRQRSNVDQRGIFQQEHYNQRRIPDGEQFPRPNLGRNNRWNQNNPRYNQNNPRYNQNNQGYYQNNPRYNQNDSQWNQNNPQGRETQQGGRDNQQWKQDHRGGGQNNTRWRPNRGNQDTQDQPRQRQYSRTSDGAPICYNCGGPHLQYYCPKQKSNTKQSGN